MLKYFLRKRALLDPKTETISRSNGKMNSNDKFIEQGLKSHHHLFNPNINGYLDTVKTLSKFLSFYALGALIKSSPFG